MRRSVFSGMMAIAAAAMWAWAAGPATDSTSRPASLGALPETRPATLANQEEARALAAKLSSADWHERRKAEAELVRMGPDAVAVLEEVARAAQLDEARTAATNALKQIAEDQLIGPSFVSLKLEDVSAQKAFEALARQSHTQLKPIQDDLWATVERKVTLDLHREPFWVAMKQLEAQTGIEIRNFNGEPRLMTSEGLMRGRHYTVSGPFLVIAGQLHRSQSIDLTQADAAVEESFDIHLTALAEPKMKILSATSQLKLDEVVDERGNSLVPERGNGLHQQEFVESLFGNDGAYALMAQLRYPRKNVGQKIARFRATATFTAQVESAKLDVPVKSLSTTTQSYKGIKLSFRELIKAGDNWQVKIIAATSEADPAWEELQSNILGHMQLLDARGQALDHHGFGSNATATSVEVTVSFGTSHHPQTDRQSGAPARLKWEIPTRTRTLTVPIELKDLKLP